MEANNGEVEGTKSEEVVQETGPPAESTAGQTESRGKGQTT
jgi:hypothetical protein